MAEKKLDVFKKTGAPGAARDAFKLDEGNIKATGVGLREGELQALEMIGAEVGELLGTEPVARNAIMRMVIRDYLEKYLLGETAAADLAGRFERPQKPKARVKR
jgi:hypothetical protein